MDVFEKMRNYESQPGSTQRRTQNYHGDNCTVSSSKRKFADSTVNATYTKQPATPVYSSRYPQSMPPFKDGSENAANPKTLTWSSPLVHSPQVKFSPKFSFNNDDVSTGESEPPNRPRYWATPSNTDAKKNSLKFPLGDKECDRQNNFNNTASTINSTDEISDICSTSFMETLGIPNNKREPKLTTLRKLPSCASDYYSQVIGHSQKRNYNQQMTQKPIKVEEFHIPKHIAKESIDHNNVETLRPNDENVRCYIQEGNNYGANKNATYTTQANSNLEGTFVKPEQMLRRSEHIPLSQPMHMYSRIPPYIDLPYTQTSQNYTGNLFEVDNEPNSYYDVSEPYRHMNMYHNPHTCMYGTRMPNNFFANEFVTPTDRAQYTRDMYRRNVRRDVRRDWIQSRGMYDEPYNYPYASYGIPPYPPSQPLIRPRNNYMLSRYFHQMQQNNFDE